MMEVQARLERLERDNRRMRGLLAGGLVVLVAALSMSFVQHDAPEDAHYRIVYASKFALVDPRTDTMRAELSHQTFEGGWAGITLWDNDGQPRAEFKLWEDGRAHLLMMDAERAELARIGVTAQGERDVVLDGADGR